MPYYTMTAKAKAWADGRGEDPRYSYFLAALDELQEDSAVPYTTEQIARVAEEDVKAAQTALDSLIKQGFVAEVAAPERTQEGRRRTRTIEELEETYQRERAASERWARSPKGKASRRKYWQGKGRQVQLDWQKTAKGRVLQAKTAARMAQRIVVTPEGHQYAQTSTTKLADALIFILLEKATVSEVDDKLLHQLEAKKYIQVPWRA